MPALCRLPLARLAALAALICATAPSAFARQQGQPMPTPPRLVESVGVVGNRRLTCEEILTHVKTRPGEPYDAEQVQRDLQALAGLGVFHRDGLRVAVDTGQRGGVDIFFAVHELPLIESVTFEGLPAGEEWALREGLRRRGLEVRADSVLDSDKLNAAMRVMERALSVRGWYNVVVELQTEEVSAASTSVKLTFVVRGLPPEKRFAPKRSDRLGRRDAAT